MKAFNKISNIIVSLLKQPLSFLRFTLSILIGKQLIKELEFVYEITDHVNYTLSKTWFTSILPDTFFEFDVSHFSFFHTLILISTIGAAIGLLGRLNLMVLGFLSFYFLGVSEGIGIFNHHISLPSQVILALALIPGSMKLSVDYFALKIMFSLKKKGETFKITENPKWGFNLILTLVALTYFTAGVSKLRYGHGLNWLDGSTLGFYLNERTELYKKGDVQLIIGDSSIKEQDKWKDRFGFIGHTYGNYQTSKKLINISQFISNNKILLILLSVGSVLFELLAFIVFINSKYRNVYLISAILFHLSIGALMGISFRQYRIICFFLIDWSIILKFILQKVKVLQAFKFKKSAI
jgi:hypothetical protein